jgi:hypothetical protein
VNDVKDLLNLALDEAPAPSVPVDPRADLARGRRLLGRRRMLGAAGLTAVMALGALVPLALQAGTPAPGHSQAVKPPAASSPSSPSSPASSRGSIALVAWTGTQPPGYRVSWLPKGWVVLGSVPAALTIGPAGDKDTDPYSFLGKLTVMLQSADVHSPPPGASQPVNGRPGIFQSAAQAGGDTEILTFQVASGKWVQVQAPMTLGWNSAELAKFAAGVVVLAAAQAGHG